MHPKKRKRKYNRKRLAIVIAVPILCLVLVVGLIIGLVSAASASNKEEEQVVLADGTVVDPVDLDSLQQEILDVFSYKSLGTLKERIQTDFYNNELSDLKAQIENYLSENNVDPDKISWAIQDLTTDAYIESDNATKDFTAASTYKLPLCALYYEAIQNGTVQMTDTLEFTENMKEEEDDENLNQPIHRKYAVGDKIQIDELLEAALLYSDNIAGHMLYENLGGYTAFKNMALKYSSATQSADFLSAQNNYFNANYMMNLVHYLYNTPDTFNSLKYWLTYATEDMFLNKDIPYTYIQKIGNIDSVRNAIGWNVGNAPFSICVYSDISKDEGEKILADLGVLVYNYFQDKYNSGYYDSYDMDHIAYLNNMTTYTEDVITNRQGLNGQTLRALTDEEKQHAAQAD